MAGRKKVAKRRAKLAVNADPRLTQVVGKAVTPIAEDFAVGSRPKDLPSTGEAIAKIVNIGANRVLSITEGLDNALVYSASAGWEFVKKTVLPKVKAKIEEIPEKERIAPPLQIVGPVLDASRFTAGSPDLTEMFAQLLVSASNKQRADVVHPSFVQIIQQLASDEAAILKRLNEVNRAAVLNVNYTTKGVPGYEVLLTNFSYVGRDAGIPVSPAIKVHIGSLCRLGLAELPEGVFLTDKALYRELEQAPELKSTLANCLKIDGRKLEFEHRVLQLTSFGKLFCLACLPQNSPTET